MTHPTTQYALIALAKEVAERLATYPDPVAARTEFVVQLSSELSRLVMAQRAQSREEDIG